MKIDPPECGCVDECLHKPYCVFEHKEPALVSDQSERFRIALAALTKIASDDDSLASDILADIGSYAGFDEPGSVKIAREAIRTLALTDDLRGK